MPRSREAETAGRPAALGHRTVLDLDAVSDYVPALDYGPLPDSDAARDYALAIDYDAPHAPALAAHGDALPDPVPVPGRAAAQDPALTASPASAWDASGPGPGAADGPPVSGLAAAGTAPAGDPWLPGALAARVSVATYWRRRMVALAVGIAALTVLAWTVSGALGGSPAGKGTGHGGQPTAAADRHAGNNRARQHHPARKGSPQALAGRAAGHVHTTSAKAGHSGRGELPGIAGALAMLSQRAPSPMRWPLPHRRSVPHRSPVLHQAMGHVPGAQAPACARGDVVLTLVSPGYWNQRGERPLFGVAAVSTGNRPCRFNMGSRAATVVVTSGRTRIWGSADCVRGSGSQTVVLKRGVPTVRWVTWDRVPSAPGCGQRGRPLRQGAYSAIAFDGQLSSQVIVVVLGRPGVALP